MRTYGDEVERILLRAGEPAGEPDPDPDTAGDAYAGVRYWTADVTRHPGGGRQAFHARLVAEDGAPVGDGWGTTPREAFLAALADSIEARPAAEPAPAASPGQGRDVR